MGCVSAAGDCLAAHCQGLQSTRRWCAPWESAAPAYPHPVFAVSGPEWVETPDEMRVAKMALKAAREALEQAGIARPPPSMRVGVFLGTTTACQFNDLEFQRAYETEGEMRAESSDRYFSGQLAERVGRRLGLPQGPRWVIANACASGTDAIGMAWNAVRQGVCDVALAGGADELTMASFGGFLSLGVLSPAPCRPFDRDRSGLNLGEGAGVVVLERASSAVRRGRTPDVFVAGYGAAADGHHMTAPHPEGLGLELAVRRALQTAHITPAEIAFINTHGTATRDNDRIEGRVLARLFGADARVVSTKGYTGHALGAVGGMEAVFTALGLSEGWLPATIGFEQQDPDIPLSPLKVITAVNGRYALSTSLAFGGCNAALVLRCDRQGGGGHDT